MDGPDPESRQGQEFFPALHKFQTGFGAHPVSHLMGTDFFCLILLEVKRSGHEVAYFPLVPSVGMNRVIPLLLLYTFIAFAVLDLLLVKKGLTTFSYQCKKITQE